MEHFRKNMPCLVENTKLYVNTESCSIILCYEYKLNVCSLITNNVIMWFFLCSSPGSVSIICTSSSLGIVYSWNSFWSHHGLWLFRDHGLANILEKLFNESYFQARNTVAALAVERTDSLGLFSPPPSKLSIIQTKHQIALMGF